MNFMYKKHKKGQKSQLVSVHLCDTSMIFRLSSHGAVLHCFFNRLPQARFNPFVRVLMANSLTPVGKGNALLGVMFFC